MSGGRSTIISTRTRQVLLSKDYITPTYILLQQTTFDREGEMLETPVGFWLWPSQVVKNMFLVENIREELTEPKLFKPKFTSI